MSSHSRPRTHRERRLLDTWDFGRVHLLKKSTRRKASPCAVTDPAFSVRFGMVVVYQKPNRLWSLPNLISQFATSSYPIRRQPEHDLFWMMPRQLCKWRLDNYTCISNCREILAVPIQPTCSEMEHMLIMPFYGRSFPLPSAHVVPGIISAPILAANVSSS